jgi:hypothetical protein
MNSVIRDSEGEITVGKFCLYGGSKSVSSGGFEEINYPVDAAFPPAGGLLVFKIPSHNYRFSINVDGTNIEGTVKQVAETLYMDYDIYVTYVEDLIIFTNSSAQERKIAVKGISEFEGENDNSDYCETFKLIDGVTLFTMVKTRYFASMQPIVYSDFPNNWNYEVYESPTDQTPLFSGSTDIDPNQSSGDYFRAISAHMNTYLGEGVTSYSSNVSEFMVHVPRWFDFTGNSTKIFDIDKGYPPYVGMPT